MELAITTVVMIGIGLVSIAVSLLLTWVMRHAVVKAAVEREREACAEVARCHEDAYCDGGWGGCTHSTGEHIATAILARGDRR